MKTKRLAFFCVLCLATLVFSVSPAQAAAQFNLLYTAHYGTVAEVQAALNRGAKVNIRRDNGSTPLIESIFNKNVGVFFLLLKNGADIHVRDQDGATPLMIVALYGKSLETQLEALLDAGADVNVQASDGCTALIYLCKKSLIHPKPADAIEQLLDRGADSSIVDAAGETAFSYAERNSGLKGTNALKRLKEMSSKR